MRIYQPNKARSYVRDLSQPLCGWTNDIAKSVYDDIVKTNPLVDMFLVEIVSRPDCMSFPARPIGHKHTDGCALCNNLHKAYGNKPHVIAYSMWDEPNFNEDAEDYLIRHIQIAARIIGGKPYIKQSTNDA